MSDPAEANRNLWFLERSRVAFALEGLENTALLFSIGPLQNNYLYFMFYMLFHSFGKTIRNLPFEKADLCFPIRERNLPKCSMSKLNNISNFYLPGQSTDSWSGSQSQTLICTCVSTAEFHQTSFSGSLPKESFSCFQQRWLSDGAQCTFIFSK